MVVGARFTDSPVLDEISVSQDYLAVQEIKNWGTYIRSAF